MATKCNLEGAMNKCRSCRTQFMYIYIYICRERGREREREREIEREVDLPKQYVPPKVNL
jgi:hypothetical protein